MPHAGTLESPPGAQVPEPRHKRPATPEIPLGHARPAARSGPLPGNKQAEQPYPLRTAAERLPEPITSPPPPPPPPLALIAQAVVK